MKNLTFKAAMLNDSRTTVERRSTDGQSQRHYKQTPLSKRWKVLMTLVFLFTFAIGQMWGQTFRYYIAISNEDATAPSGAVRVFKTSDDEHFTNVTSQFTLTEYSTSSAGSVYYTTSKTYVTSSGDGCIMRSPRYTKNKTFTINWTNTNLSFNKITFQGVGTNSGTKNITVKNSSTDEGDVVQFPKSSALGTYEKTKNFTQTNGITLVSANDQPAYAITILHAVDHAEITSTETEMVTSESLQMEGFPDGGTWSIAEGGTGTASITSAGVLTASANGTIKVKYAKEGYGEDIKTITVSDSRTIHWFAAGNTDAATNEVSNNTSFFSFNTTSTSDQSGNITIGSKTYSLTKRLNAEQTTWSFTIPSNTTGTLNVVAISSGGSDRTLTMQKSGESGTIELGSTTNQKNAWSLITKVDIPAGTYTVSSNGNVRFGMMRMIINKTEPAASYTITYDANGGSGDPMASSTNTVSACTYTAPTGKEFKEWNTLATGLGDSYDPGDAAPSDLDLFAIWQTKVEKFTVVYKDGTTELGSEVVEVGEHPTGSGITTPSKDFYTFAAWSPALNTVSGTDGQVVNVNATWTAQYTSGTYEFTGNLTMGTDPQMTIENNTSGKGYSAGRIDNIYVDAQTIGYEATGNYGGWKLKSQNKGMRFLVENASGIRVALGEANPLRIEYTEGGVAKSADIAKSTTSSVYKADANTIVRLTNTTTGTVTLKKLEILPLYNATYTTSKSSVDPTSASNVTEVTLPTPSETTVGGYSFTGWVADKTVYDDEENEKTAGADLTAGKTYTLTATTEFTAQWALISDFDVKFFQGYGDPDVQIGDKQTISTGNFAVAPADPTRTGFAFLGWSYDATEAHIVDVATYGITAETNFTAMWKQVFTVTFDGEGSVNVESGSKVASPNSPSQAGKVFQGWYNGESKYDFSAAVTANLALTSKWEDANVNHFYYNYKDDFHYDGVVYKSPEGKVDNKDGESNKAITTPYTLFSGAAGISSIVATKAIYDSKSNWVNAYLKINTSEDSYLTFTIASGYTAVLKMKMGGYSSDPTITLKKGEETIAATSGTPGGKQASKENDFNEIVYDLVAGTYTMTTATKTLYISHIDLEATALPTFTVTYVPGEGTGDEVVDNDATMVADCPAGFTAPTGKAFNGWKDGDNNDVEVGATVTESMTLTAQWINQYAVTFDMQGHGTAVDPQYIKHGAKATKPADPFVMGWDFGGWFTEATCENEFDFNTAIEAATPLFAKWTEFIGCTMLYPAKSGDAIAVGDPIVMQDGSFGGAMSALAIPDGGALTYNNNGLQFATKTGVKANVVLNNDIVAGTKIILTLVAGGEKTRGLFLYTKDGDKIDDFTCWVDGVNPASNGLEDTFTYTVQAGDGLEGTNEFQLWRNNTVYLKSLKVSSCGDAIIYHDLTSEVNIAGKGTVTLGANTVREGHTTTATYSDIDPLYEFVSWSVSGTGANIENATANPATITMGTEDAVVTLNLKVKPVKFTVNYYDGTTLKGTEEVTVNEYPTASEVVTAKRHFTFQGWSTTDGGSVVALNTITSDVAATISLYAVYAPVACPTEGAVFSMEFDPAKTPESTVKALRNGGVVELSEYATISGGDARIINNETGSDKDAITTSGQFKLTANGEVMKIELDCAIATGDVIRIPDNNQKYILSTKADKTGTYQSQTSSQHEFEATAAWNGVDDLYILYDGSSLNFTKVYVLRPYTVSFDLQGHGDAIDAQKLVAGKKVEAPTAPTADGWDFGGWYKEAACTNAWDFDNDVVDGTATLFAKWSEHVYNDATLKSLTYGGEEIALEDGIYEYNIELPALTTAVPALAAETNSALATRLITNAESFDGDGKATSTVKVTSEDHTVELTYTVNFTKIAAVELQDVTGDFTWDFSKAVSAEKTVPTTLTVLANIYGVANNADFKSDNLMGASGKMKTGFAQVKTLKFHATVPGKLTVVFSNTGNKEYDRILYINGVATTAKSKNQTPVTYNVVVPAGDVLIQGWETKENPEDETWNMLNFYSMDFDVDLDPTKTGESTLGGYERDVTEGRYGTICLPKAGVMVGATIYTLAYYGETSQKIFFDEVVDGTMEAGKPYLFLPNEGVDRIGVYYTNQTTKTAQTVNGFVGYIGASEDSEDALPVPDGDGNYIVQNNQYREILAGATAYILSHRAYIHFAGINTSEPAKAPGARRIGISGAPQVATGMDALNTAEAPVKVMIDGQLFILRGEKMYDATGRLVK